MKHSNDFNYDLAFGESAEDWLKELFGDKFKVEVKNDRHAHRTGNAYIEVRSRGKPSGLATTKADYWVYRLAATGLALIIPIKLLKNVCVKIYQRNNKQLVKAGDNNTSEGLLVPLEEFLN